MPAAGGQSTVNYLYLCEYPEEIQPYQDFVRRNDTKIHSFLTFLKQQYAVVALPNSVILTSADIATRQISSIPLPGYTNEFRTVFCPEADVWRSFYLQQITEPDDPRIREYYNTRLTEDHVLQILGHEFVHHSDLFIDETWEIARWFEEGMCEYISRTYFLTGAEFEDEARINELLVKRYEERYGIQSPESFCRDTYSGSLEDIFYFYWKSFLVVQSAVQKFGSVEAVFREYHRWFREEPTTPLSVWFRI